jgi:poly-beta-1,6-N-acetyl-D-glucosamine biosynthesis protein PgaD
MSLPQAPLSSQRWPPIITGVRLPVLVTVRDVLLTLMAWCALGWLLRGPIYVAYDYLRHPIFELTTARPLDVGLLLWRLRYFWIITALLIVWLSLWAVISRRRLRAAIQSPQPPPLTMSEQAARFSVAESSVNAAREFRITDIRFQENDTIAGFQEATRP